jgi:hypothetical protein
MLMRASLIVSHHASLLPVGVTLTPRTRIGQAALRGLMCLKSHNVDNKGAILPPLSITFGPTANSSETIDALERGSTCCDAVITVCDEAIQNLCMVPFLRSSDREFCRFLPRTLPKSTNLVLVSDFNPRFVFIILRIKVITISRRNIVQQKKLESRNALI